MSVSYTIYPADPDQGRQMKVGLVLPPTPDLTFAELLDLIAELQAIADRMNVAPI